MFPSLGQLRTVQQCHISGCGQIDRVPWNHSQPAARRDLQLKGGRDIHKLHLSWVTSIKIQGKVEAGVCEKPHPLFPAHAAGGYLLDVVDEGREGGPVREVLSVICPALGEPFRVGSIDKVEWRREGGRVVLGRGLSGLEEGEGRWGGREGGEKNGAGGVEEWRRGGVEEWRRGGGGVEEGGGGMEEGTQSE